MKTQFAQISITALAALVLSLHAGPASSHSNPSNSPAAGGGGGTAFTMNCGHDSGRVLIGIRGRSGGYVDSIRGICASWNQVMMATDIGNTPLKGGTGGTRDFHYRCPTGHALVGLHGKAGGFIDSVGIECAPIRRDGTVDSTGRSRWVGFSGSGALMTTGGTGGNAFSVRCPNNLPARSLKGRAAQFVDRLQLGCHNAIVPPVSTTISRSAADAAVAIRNLPFVSNRTDSVTAKVELWNVGSVVLPFRPLGESTDSGASAFVDIETNAGFATFSINFLGQGSCNTRVRPVRCRPHQGINPGQNLTVNLSWSSQGSSGGAATVSARAGFEGRVIERTTSNNEMTAEVR